MKREVAQNINIGENELYILFHRLPQCPFNVGKKYKTKTP